MSTNYHKISRRS